MAINRSLLAVPLVSILTLLPSPGWAQHIPIGSQQSYRILPRLSVLTRSYSELEAPTIPYRVQGTFDFKIEPSPLAVFPPVFNAKFVEPEVWATHPHQDVVLDVDELFNLEGLAGFGQSRLFPHRPRVFHFNGTTSGRSTVDLHALVVGRWLYLRGELTPPHDTDALLPEYHLRAIARQQPSGDFNDDGIVDADDLRAWIDNHRRHGGDFLHWQRSLGEEPPTLEALDAELNAALTAAASAVPEPSSLGAGALAGFGLLGLNRRRRTAGGTV